MYLTDVKALKAAKVGDEDGAACYHLCVNVQSTQDTLETIQLKSFCPHSLFPSPSLSRTTPIRERQNCAQRERVRVRDTGEERGHVVTVFVNSITCVKSSVPGDEVTRAFFSSSFFSPSLHVTG